MFCSTAIGRAAPLVRARRLRTLLIAFNHAANIPGLGGASDRPDMLYALVGPNVLNGS